MLKLKNLLYLALLAIVILLPFFVSNRYYLHILIICGIYVIIAQALNLVVGYTGYISFAHNALYGVGAYASALMMQSLGFSFWISFPLAVVVASVIGFVVGYLPLKLKLKGPYFTLVTMAFGLVVVSVLHNWESLTGGPAGLASIPGPGSFLGLSLDSRRAFYYFVWFFAIVTIVFISRLINSKLGRSFKAIGQDEDMAEAVGVNIGYYKILCFVISSGLTGMAGSFYAHYTRFLGPDMFAIFEAVDMLTMVIVGGMGTIIGPVVGAVVIVILPEVLRGLAEYRQVIFSIILILTIMFVPQGLVGIGSLLKSNKNKIFQQSISDLPAEDSEN